MKYILLFLFALLSTNAFAIDFPRNPNAQLTPGSLCDHPSEYRYPENIPYCERDVSSQLKKEIFDNYRTQLGYRLDPDHRSSYKIDHFIPLCAGGSNDEDNLWPQHKSIYEITDPIEPVGCEKLAEARITQKDLVELVKEAKLNLSEAPRILKYLKSL